MHLPVGEPDFQVGIDGDEQQQEDGELGGDQGEAGEEEAAVEAQGVLHAQHHGEGDSQGPHPQVSHCQAPEQVVGDTAQLLVKAESGTHQQVGADDGYGQEALQEHKDEVHIHAEGASLPPP